MNVEKSVFVSLVVAILTTGAAQAEGVKKLKSDIILQLPEVSDLEKTTELESFVSANVDRLDRSTVDSLRRLLQSKSPLAIQVVDSMSLDKKMAKFKSTLSVTELERFSQLQGKGTPLDISPDEKSEVNSSLSEKLRVFQTGLNDGESEELVNRLTQFGNEAQSSFGVGPSA